VFMRATLQGVTQMGKSRPGATALRQHVQSLLQGGVGGPLLADGGIRSGGRRTFVPSAPTVTIARWGPLPVWTGRSRSRGPKQSRTDSVLVVLVLRRACSCEDGARYEGGVVHHRVMRNVRENFKRRLRQALTRLGAVVGKGNDYVFLPTTPQ
jgi:hypothetical protein